MPGRDRTGPDGQGSKSGKGLGRCSGINAKRRGKGCGCGCRRSSKSKSTHEPENLDEPGQATDQQRKEIEKN
ncbi:DUF5320 domain-containing protein [Acetobacterium carbinolicum]|uniref:DUF5320 domain-containing protein n=1 Tax=Acetobacterium carbinolicum TaxID=52690 RepID=UPI0029E21A28|nr:hypothetical protein [Eubacteriaceae bacterium]MDK2961092.1 hypothetical protein [Eubacteriaceae bacterium]